MLKETEGMLIELSKEQHNIIKNFCSENNTSKADFIRMICDALKGINPSNAHIVVHDDKILNFIVHTEASDGNKSVILKGTELNKNMQSIKVNMEYTRDIDFFSNYEISETQTIRIGGEGKCSSLEK